MTADLLRLWSRLHAIVLVTGLGAHQFAIREHCERRLMVWPDLSPLMGGLESESAEVSFRCRRMVGRRLQCPP